MARYKKLGHLGAMDRALDPKLLGIFDTIARLCAGAAVLIGALDVIGRLANISEISFASGGVGLSFLLFGLALLLLTRQARFSLKIIGYLLAGFGSAIGAINFARYFFDLQLVNLLSDIDINGFQPAVLITMSPSDCILILAIGLAILTVDLTIKRVRPSEFLAFFATLGCVMTIIGVILHIDSFCMFVACTRISDVTGAAFFILCVAALLARPTTGLIALFPSPNAGGVAIRRLIPLAIAIPVFVSWLRMYLEKIGMPAELALTLMVASMVVLFGMLLWWSSWSIERLDDARQLAMTKLRQSEKRTRMVVQQAIDAFVAVDSNGLIKDWNEQALEIFGWTKDELIDKSIIETLVPKRFAQGAADGIKYLINNAKGTSASKPIEAVAVKKDGSEFPVELSLFPVSVDSERILCAFVRDITERKQVEQRFREFYSTVSHELRTPLTSMRGSLGLVQQLATDMQDTGKEMLKICDRSLDRLIRLVNDLLDVKRIEEGQLKLELQPLDPIKMGTLAVDGLKGIAAQASVELELVVDDSSTFIGDADRVVQVLTNLVSNAIKFSPKDRHVLVRILKSKNPQLLRFQIEDQGKGIAAAQIKTLFNPFAQLADGKSKLGTGLGLAISKAIVEEHGGEIGVESSDGHGTIFWFELPLTQRPVVTSAQMATLNLQPLDLEV